MIGSDEAVYVVMASHGEYSDHKEWIVCAYRDQADAELHAERANHAARVGAYLARLCWEHGDSGIEMADFDDDDGMILRSEYDPDPDLPAHTWFGDRHRFHNAVNSHTGSLAYAVWTVPLMSSVPQPVDDSEVPR